MIQFSDSVVLMCQLRLSTNGGEGSESTSLAFACVRQLQHTEEQGQWYM